MKTIYAKDYKIFPDSGKDYTLEINRMLNSVDKDAEIYFERGIYSFRTEEAFQREYAISNTYNTQYQEVSIPIEGRKRIIMDFQGSELLFSGWVIPISIDRCEDILIRNLYIDWKIPSSAEGKVLSSNSKEIVIAIDRKTYPYFVDNGKLIFKNEEWETEYWAALEFNSFDRTVRAGAADTILKAHFTENEDGSITMRGDFKVPPLVENILLLRHGMRTRAGIFCQDSDGIAFENITLYNSCGIGIVCQFSRNIRFENVSMIPNVSKGRKVVSVHDDGIQCSNCSGELIIRRCCFRGLMDDSINIHGTSTRIVEICKNTVKGIFVEKCSDNFKSYAKTGDIISFLDNETMNVIGSAIVDSFHLLNCREYEITFLGELSPEIKCNDAMENLSNTPEVLCECNYFGSGRARGILVTTPRKVIIRHNVFNTSGTAILCSGDVNGWFESGACKDIAIYENYFSENCLSCDYEFGVAIISFYPSIKNPEASKGFHENIKIFNNMFLTRDKKLLHILCANNVSFYQNYIFRETECVGKAPEYITLQNCTNCNTENNIYCGEPIDESHIRLKETH